MYKVFFTNNVYIQYLVKDQVEKLGVKVEQYFLSVQKPVHLGQLGCCWVADTLGEYKPIKGKGRK